MSGTSSPSNTVEHSNMNPDVVQNSTMMESPTREDTTTEDTVMEDQEAVSQTPSTPDSPIADGPATKVPMHQRIIQRISRSASLASIWSASGRERSSSAPLHSSSGPSCISLATSATPSTSGSNAFSSNSASATATEASSRPDSPSTTPFPDFPHALETSQSNNAIRKVDLTTLPGGPSTSSLPAAMARTASTTLVRQGSRPRPQFKGLWEGLPYELKLRVLSHLPQKDLVRASETSRSFHKACLDGQLWHGLDSTVLSNKMPIESMQTLMTKAGAFMKHLSLRGYYQAQFMGPQTLDRVNCTNLVSLALEGSAIGSFHLKTLLQANKGLVSLDLKGLGCVDDMMCNTIAESCPKLQVLDLSWCKNITPRGVTAILSKCRELLDVRLAEMPQFGRGRPAMAVALYNMKHLRCLDLSYCKDITDESLEIIMHGINPPRDEITNELLTSQQFLRHLDISHCPNLRDRSIEVVGQCTPLLESLTVTGLSITGVGFRHLLAKAKYLKTLDLDDVSNIHDDLLVNGIAKAPMAKSLRHFSVSACELVSDDGVIAILKACPNLQTLRVDGTNITDATMFAAAKAMCGRQPVPCSKKENIAHPAHIGLSMDVFDCSEVTWEGIQQIMKANNRANDPKSTPDPTHSTPIAQLKCYYGWQQVVQLHTARVMSGSGGLADRLMKSWAAFMAASQHEMLYGGDGMRLRLRARRERIAALEHFNQTTALAEANREEDDVDVLAGRLRSRTMECAIM